jgi:hypothetical protein
VQLERFLGIFQVIEHHQDVIPIAPLDDLKRVCKMDNLPLATLRDR